MAKIVIEKWKCDVCEKECSSEKDMRRTNIPCYAGIEFKLFDEASLDLCPECSTKLREVISKHFAHIIDNYGKITVKKPE